MKGEFEESFLALRYLLGLRGTELLDNAPPALDTRSALAQGLTAPERGTRAAALRAPLRRLISALDERELA